MKKIVFAALAMSLASSLAAQPKQTLSFDEALNLTLTNNRASRRQRMNKKPQSANVKQHTAYACRKSG